MEMARGQIFFLSTIPIVGRGREISEQAVSVETGLFVHVQPRRCNAKGNAKFAFNQHSCPERGKRERADSEYYRPTARMWLVRRAGHRATTTRHSHANTLRSQLE
jgi:hypothetical protein